MKYMFPIFGIIVLGIAVFLIVKYTKPGYNLTYRVIPDLSTKLTCKGDNKKLEIAQTGRYWCREILPDAEKPCSKSSDCISGHCMTHTPQASSGKCYESKNGDFCLWGVTIEKSQNMPKESLILPCVY